MSSKAPSLNGSAPEERIEQKGSDQPPVISGSRANFLLRQIADALQVPVSVLFNPPNQRDTKIERRDDASASTTDLSAECAALLRAYTSICDPAERRRYLHLLQAAAERA